MKNASNINNLIYVSILVDTEYFYVFLYIWMYTNYHHHNYDLNDCW